MSNTPLWCEASGRETRPLTQFTDLGLAEPLLRAVASEGYTRPTPIQAEVIPLMMAGRDVIGIAQTGTGKTASFVLPLLHRIRAARKRPQRKSCGALILSPTRELAQQIADNIRTYSQFMKVSVAVVVGGVKISKQIYTLGKGVDIVVATPGRLLDLAESGDVHLDTCQCVILDEADQMLDLGFMPSIRKILAKLPKQRQTLLLSATMPKQIRALAQEFLRNPAEVAVTPVSRPIERIEQSVMHVPTSAKRKALTEIIINAGTQVRAIVFTRTKRGADRVTRYLAEAGLRAEAIHGNKRQSIRERTLAAFRNGNTSILVATDIAARGINIDDVSHVINFELPNVPESYVHRIGRTARAGRGGIAISLCDPEERKLLRAIERLTETRLTPLGDEPRTPDQARDKKASPNRPTKPRKPNRKNKKPQPKAQQARPKSKPKGQPASKPKDRPTQDGQPKLRRVKRRPVRSRSGTDTSRTPNR